MEERVKPRKKAVNLSIDAELLGAAKVAGTNLSAVLETALRERLKTTLRDEWLARNRDALAADLEELERNGPWYTPDWMPK